MKMVKLANSKYVIMLATGAQVVYASGWPILLRTPLGRWHRSELENKQIKKYVDTYLKKAEAEFAIVMTESAFWYLVESV